DHERLVVTIDLEAARLVVGKGAEDAGDLANLIGLTFGLLADLVAFVAQAPAHLDKEVTSVDELDLAAALRLLPIRQYPDVRRYSSVVEKLIGEPDDRLEPVVFDDPL